MTTLACRVRSKERLHHLLTPSYNRPDPSSVLLCPQKLDTALAISYFFCALSSTRLPLLLQGAPIRYTTVPKPTLKQALSKTKCSISSAITFCRHYQAPETNHPKPGKPCVEVNFAKGQSLRRTPLLASHSAPIVLLILGYALLWV
jgi:hypothetical protein